MTVTLALHDFGGSGPLMVLGPSLGTSVQGLWAEVAEQLVSKFHVVGWDLPGHGTSKPGEVRDLAALGAAVLAALDNAGIDGDFDYAGDSIGGAVGLHLAILAPQRLRTATLLCTGARIGTPQSWHERSAGVRADGTRSLLPHIAERWFAPGFTARHTAAAQRLLDDLAAADDASYAGLCDALGAHDVRAELEVIAVPVLAVAGAQDQATPTASLRHLADGVQRGRLEVLDGVAHLAPIEAPQSVADLITDHIERTPDADLTTGQVRASGMRVRREVLGDDWVDAASEGAGGVTSDFQRFITEYAWGGVWTRPGLDRRSRSIVTITALVARGHHEELAAHLRAALGNGLTAEEIVEVLLQTAIYCGVPDANAAFRVAARVLGEGPRS